MTTTPLTHRSTSGITYTMPNTPVAFPEIHVKLVGTDGNAFSVMGKVVSALRKGGVPKERIDQYMNDAMSGDYNHLLAVSMQTVAVS